MKKLSLFLVALAMLLVACKPEIEKPTVVTKSVGEITQTTAKIVGQVTEDGGAEVTERGACWSTEGTPTILDFRTVDGTGVGSYTSSLSDLAPQTTYYVRAYATNEAGTAYGEEKSFTTLEVIPEEPGDEPETPIEPEEPGDEPEEPGDEPEEPGDEPEEPGDEPEEPGDEPEEPGDEPETPIEPEEPGDDEEEEVVCDCNFEFRIEEITDIGINSADAIVNLSSGAYNAEYIGVCWNTSGNPHPEMNNVDKYWSTVFHGEGIYEISMDYLEENTTYYVRPYVECYNHDEYILGEEVIIKTMEPKLPTVTTAEVVEMINCTSVECSAEVTSVGYLGQSLKRRGFCWSTTSTPTVNDNEIHESGGYYTDANYTMRLENLLPQTTYYVRAYATNEVGTAYGEERIFTTLPIEGTLNGYTWVDLALPSGTKWATCNVGATTPEEYGDYFAWGETSTKETYDEDNCPTYGLNIPTLEAQGYVDSRGNLTAQYDAATTNWGGTWRMPTCAELNELHTNCTWTWTAQNGVNGYNVEGPNGKSIFLPAAGSRSESSLHNAGSNGNYWSSTPKDHYGWYTEDCASGLGFSSSKQIVDNDNRDRSYGRSVRPVLD